MMTIIDVRCVMRVSMNLTRVILESFLFDEIVASYNSDPDYTDIIAYLRALSDAALEALLRTKQNHIQRYTFR